LAEHILLAAAFLVFLGVLLGVLRLILGPTVIDRIAAIDMVLTAITGWVFYVLAFVL